ncbi:hypothetical protein BG004_004891 [Podila humilis]|nr:hypothetical protein BG004_004891 [Podila humilis]
MSLIQPGSVASESAKVRCYHHDRTLKHRTASTTCSTSLFQYNKCQHSTWAIKPGSARMRRLLHHSKYDPDLASCMNRWVHMTLLGQQQQQRRVNSSVAKTIQASSIPSYTLSDIPSTQQDRLLRNQSTAKEQTSVSTSIYSSTTSAQHTSIPLDPAEADLRDSIDRLQISLYEPHASQFRSFTKQKPRGQGPRKQIPSDAVMNSVDQVWDHYCRIRTTKGTRLTRSDYTMLMRTCRLTRRIRDGARRILALKTDLEGQGMILTSKMQEMVIQSHFILGEPRKSVLVFQSLGAVLTAGSAEYKRMMWTMVDGYATSERFCEGFEFLDQIKFTPGKNDYHEFDPEWKSRLYNRLLFQHLQSKSTRTLYSETGINLLSSYTDWQFPPPPDKFESLLTRLEAVSKGGPQLLFHLSKSVSESLVSTKQYELLTLLIASLVRSYQLSEAFRVVSVMKDRDLDPPIDMIRQHLLRSLDTCNGQGEQEGAMDQWEELMLQFDTPTVDTSACTDRSEVPQTHEHLSSRKYSRILQECVENNDMEGASQTAQYLSSRGWTPSRIDFRKLNSAMVNFGGSENYIKYLEMRYSLGVEWAKPDLHAYRRLIYAACRRSDLFSALSMFKLARSRHPTWVMDPSIYNAIISTAAVKNQILVAERTFRCMLEDGQKPDHFSFHGLLNGYCVSGDLDAALLVPEKMVKLKLVPTTKTFNLIMKAYLSSRRDVTTSRKLFKVMQQSTIVPPNLVTFNQLLEGYRRVGNMTWFDDYFDRYFGSRSRTAPAVTPIAAATCVTPSVSKPCSSARLLEFNQKETQALCSQSGQELPPLPMPPSPVIRPRQADDKTLLIQLKYSLALPSVGTSSVWELWEAVRFKVDIKTALEGDNLWAEGPPTVTPATHVPFKKSLSKHIVLPMTEHDHFRYTVLALFRKAFKTRGDTKGVKRMDAFLYHMFPGQPMDLTEWEPSRVGRIKVLKSSTLNNGKGHHNQR